LERLRAQQMAPGETPITPEEAQDVMAKHREELAERFGNGHDAPPASPQRQPDPQGEGTFKRLSETLEKNTLLNPPRRDE